jgi:hypothetical protein
MMSKIDAQKANVNAACLVAFGLLLFTSAAGPARSADPQAEVLATIDGVPAVTAADVTYYLGKREGNVKPAAITTKDVAQAVDELVAAEILVMEAEAAGYADAEYVKNEVAKFQHKALQELMLRTLENEPPVTEEELRAFYEADSKWRKYSFIICKNRQEAEAARRELANGKLWAEVFATYAVNDDKTAAGAWPTPMLYDGREASQAVFDTPVGEYSPAVSANDGIRWYVYRVDKVVHGRADTFEEARPGLASAVSTLRGIKNAEKLTAELRQSVPVNRHGEMWRTLLEEPFSAFEAKCGTPGAVVADAGGIPIFGGEFAFLFQDFLGLGPAGLDEYRADDPEDFAYVADRILIQLENRALLEYAAIERGLDKDEAYVRAWENRRADLITDSFIAREFAAKLPPSTEEDVRRYYDDHPERFLIPEMLECYIIALADREKVETFYERVVGGESIVSVGESYNQKRGRELTDMYETPPSLPPEKEDFVRAITVYREPNPKEPELPLTADLRGRVFARPEVGMLSGVFQLADGRWAFYDVTYYQPPGKEEFSDEGVKIKCYKLARAEYLSGDEVDARAREWLAELRTRHDITRAPELYAGVAASVNYRR